MSADQDEAFRSGDLCICNYEDKASNIGDGNLNMDTALIIPWKRSGLRILTEDSRCNFIVQGLTLIRYSTKLFALYVLCKYDDFTIALQAA